MINIMTDIMNLIGEMPGPIYSLICFVVFIIIIEIIAWQNKRAIYKHDVIGFEKSLMLAIVLGILWPFSIPMVIFFTLGALYIKWRNGWQ